MEKYNKINKKIIKYLVAILILIIMNANAYAIEIKGDENVYIMPGESKKIMYEAENGKHIQITEPKVDKDGLDIVGYKIKKDNTNQVELEIIAKKPGVYELSIPILYADSTKIQDKAEVTYKKLVVEVPSKVKNPEAGKKVEVENKLEAKQDVNIRSEATAASTNLGKLRKGEQVEKTGESKNGFDKVIWNGKTVYIADRYLKKPEAKQEPEEVEVKQEDIDQKLAENKQKKDEEEIKELKEDIPVMPNVGDQKNYIPFAIFGISCIMLVSYILYIKNKNNNNNIDNIL